MSGRRFSHLRSGLVRGFLIVLPLLVTIWVLKLHVGIVATLVSLYLVGVIAGSFVGRRIVRMIEDAVLMRIPFVKGIYGPAHQLLDALSTSGKRALSNVVRVEHPRLGVRTGGIVCPHDLARRLRPWDEAIQEPLGAQAH